MSANNESRAFSGDINDESTNHPQNIHLIADQTRTLDSQENMQVQHLDPIWFKASQASATLHPERESYVSVYSPML